MVKIYVTKKAQSDAQIKELLGKSKLTLTEISKALKKDKGNISKSLARLINNGDIYKTEDNKFYNSGWVFLEEFFKESDGYFEQYSDSFQIPSEVPTYRIDDYISMVSHNHPTIDSMFLMDDPDLKITFINED